MKATGNAMRLVKSQRRSLTKPEAMLWRLLRGSPNGVRFRRQYAVGPYVADFYCPSARLVIEIDGSIHEFTDRAERDSRRDQRIADLGLRVIRIRAAEVLADPAAVADGLVRLCSQPGPSTSFAGPPPHEAAPRREDI